jgi:hypothetical protein
MSLEECLEEIVSIFTDHRLPTVILVSIAKSHTDRLIQPQNVSSFRPTVGINFGRFTIGVDTGWTILSQQGQGGRTAGSTSKPNHKRNFRRFLVIQQMRIAFFKHPEEEVLQKVEVRMNSERQLLSFPHFVSRGVLHLVDILYVDACLLNHKVATVLLHRWTIKRLIQLS